MSLRRPTKPTKGKKASVSLRCSLPELYASVENFNKDSKKSNLLKTRGISLKEAQKLLSESLDAISSTGARREDAEGVSTCAVVKKAEKAQSMAELLHRSLLLGSLAVAQRRTGAHHRLLRSGIPPPVHTFPYHVTAPESKAWLQSTILKKILGIKRLGRFSLSTATPKRPTFEETVLRYLSVDPERQFIDLKDLEWRYFKGLAKWKHTTAVSLMDARYNIEKRFVESHSMPGIIFPPLVRKSLVTYPQIDYQKEGNCYLKWDM